MRTIFWMAACFLSLLWSVPSQACTFTETAFWRDKPINILSDGSFNEAEESSLSGISGKAPVDIGKGKIGQRITFSGPCDFVEYLLVVDCISLETIVIQGLPDPEAIAYFYYSSPEIFRLYPPHGKIRLTKSVTVAELAAISAAEGYEYETDLQKVLGVKKKKNIYNTFTGCKVLYPESPGATQ
jgi:hypothetical protein